MTATIAPGELEIAINRPIETAWKALAGDTAFWWPKYFYAKPKAKGFHIEPNLGEKMFEDYGRYHSTSTVLLQF